MVLRQRPEAGLPSSVRLRAPGRSAALCAHRKVRDVAASARLEEIRPRLHEPPAQRTPDRERKLRATARRQLRFSFHDRIEHTGRIGVGVLGAIPNPGNTTVCRRRNGGARSPRKRVCAGKFPANRENNRDNLKIGPFLSKIKTERFELSDGWAINSLRVRAGNKCAVTGN